MEFCFVTTYMKTGVSGMKCFLKKLFGEIRMKIETLCRLRTRLSMHKVHFNLRPILFPKEKIMTGIKSWLSVEAKRFLD